MSFDASTQKRIVTLLQDHRVILFMKGTRQQPMCGFSATAVRLLDSLLPDYHTFNVLDDPLLREGIKAFAQWPTIPQLYVNAKLVGGADIIQQMHESGQLHQLLGLPRPDRSVPGITITPRAVEAITHGMTDTEGLVLHLDIGPDHSASFKLTQAHANDIVSRVGDLNIHFSPTSAQRAHGIVIDWVSTVQGEGLSLKFPGAQEIRTLDVQTLKQQLACDGLTLIDVRPAAQRTRFPPLPQARILENEGYDTLATTLPRDAPLAFICQHGRSSYSIAERFAAHGFTQVHNVEGGMEAWTAATDGND